MPTPTSFQYSKPEDIPFFNLVQSYNGSGLQTYNPDGSAIARPQSIQGLANSIGINPSTIDWKSIAGSYGISDFSSGSAGEQQLISKLKETATQLGQKQAGEVQTKYGTSSNAPSEKDIAIQDNPNIANEYTQASKNPLQPSNSTTIGAQGGTNTPVSPASGGTSGTGNAAVSNSSSDPHNTVGSVGQGGNSQTQGNTQQNAGISLAGNLQQGSTGNDVKQIQSVLGITSDGIFGPKTSAAVKAFQAAHGLSADGIVGPKTLQAMNAGNRGPSDSSNVMTGAGSAGGTSGAGGGFSSNPISIPSTGNPGIDSLIQLLNNQSPQKSFADIYKETYTSLGIDGMNTDYKNMTDQYTALQDQKNTEKEDINNYPWYTEGVRQQKLNQLDAKYQDKEDNLTSQLKLLETNITNSRADAQFVAGKIADQLDQSQKLNEDVIMKAIDISEKQIEAEASLNKPVVLGENSRLVNPATGKVVASGGNSGGNINVTGVGNVPTVVAPYLQTSSSGINWVDASTLQGTAADKTKIINAAQAAGYKILTNKNQAADISNIADANNKLDTIAEIMTGIDQPDALSRNLYGLGLTKLATLAQTNPQQAAAGSLQSVGLDILKAISGVQGFRGNQTAIQQVTEHLPSIYDTDAVVQQKIGYIRQLMADREKGILGSANSSSPSNSGSSKFDYLAPNITTAGTNAYLPQSAWSKVSGSEKDDLLAYIKSQGYNLLITN